MRISISVFLTFTCVIVLFGTTLFVIKDPTSSRLNRISKVSTAGETKDLIHNFQRNFEAATMGLRGYLITYESRFLSVYDSALKDNKRITRALVNRFPLDSEQRILLDDVTEIQDYWLTEFSTPLIAARQFADTSAKKIAQFNERYKIQRATGLERDVLRSMRTKFQSIDVLPFAEPKQTSGQTFSSFGISKDTSLVLVSIVLAFGLTGWLTRYLSKKAESVVATAKSIAEGNVSSIRPPYKGNDPFSVINNTLADIGAVLKGNIDRLRKQRIELDELTHILLHDVKLPLTDIQNTIYAIRANPVCASDKSLLDQIVDLETKATKAEEIVTDMTMFGMEGKRKPARELVAIQDIVDDIRSRLAVNPDITITTRGTLPVLYADKSLLDQILLNMMLNLVCHHPDVPVEITIWCAKQNATYHLFVHHSFEQTCGHRRHQDPYNVQSMTSLAGFPNAGSGLSLLKMLIAERGVDLRMNVSDEQNYVFCLVWPRK